ncbi:hypothetical protein [Nonomuraea wenchangensis]|uniref:Uncharacterized protein n=1 Tax=Nonomuraea wenchangensis TaxID=568860 RepID=A0A1I0JP10_9ACTN|nr:hypothetical protein [Nonomuraea wenchangensis]SEU12219.1 hypothetical protein SAMN05421811_10684 [Nonomuraea wenchangensis]
MVWPWKTSPRRVVIPDRASVPRELWLRLLTDAQERMDVLVFSGTFYAPTQPKIARLLPELDVPLRR